MTTETPRHRRPRLADVAAAAGVSLGAASKALAQPDAVRPRTLEAVRAAVEHLGYIASDRGRALASRFTGTIGVVLPTINNPVFADFVHELQRSLWSTDRQLLALAHEYDRDLEAEQIERLVRRGVDALVLVGTDQDPAALRLLRKVGVPHLFTWSTDDADRDAVIGFSNRNAMHALVAHLAELGHRRIAVISGDPQDNERARWRLVGIKEATGPLGLEIVAIETAALTIEGGRQAYVALDPLARGATALICATDTVAAGALDAARKAGVAIPAQLSIAGFDDIELSALFSPPLTTVRAPISRMAMSVADAIHALLDREVPPPRTILPTSLVVRQSTGPAPVP